MSTLASPPSDAVDFDLPSPDGFQTTERPVFGFNENQRQFWRDQFGGVVQGGKYKPRTFKPELVRKEPLQHGWMLKYLVDLESRMWGRWDYWCEIMSAQKLIDRPIPQIPWDDAQSNASRSGRKFLEHALNQISPGSHWNSWGSWTNYEYLLDWLLFGFGHHGHLTPPPEPDGAKGASDRLYQCFDLGPLLLAPMDHLGDILAENAHGRHLGFFPTPMHVCDLMARMIAGTGDQRMAKTCDPCLGTGRMLLAASNWSLRLYGQDINPIVIKTAMVNGYMFAPWLVKPFGFLDASDVSYLRPDLAPAASDQLAQMASNDPRGAAYVDWFQTEHDAANQPAVHPIKIRRMKATATKPSPYEQTELDLSVL